MDYRSLVNKLEAIERGTVAEDAAPAAAPAGPTPAQVIQKYVDLAKTPDQAQAFIDPKDGVVKWIDKNTETGQGSPRAMPSDWIQRYAPDLAKALADTGAGTEQKGLFGLNNGTKVDLTKVAQSNATTTSDAFIKEKVAKLKELVAKLQAGGQGAKPAAATPAGATSVAQAKAAGAANPQVPAATPAPAPATPDPTLKVYKEGSMSKELVESFGYETTNEGPATTAALKAGGKLGARILPGAGLALGAYDAYNRAKQGDWTGAAIDAAGGIAGLVPGVGTAAQLGLMGVQAGRDKARTGSWMPDDTEIAAAAKGQAPAGSSQAAKPAAGVDPKVKALQDKLIAAGAKNIDGTPLVADGRMGPNTQAAMKQFPQVKESVAESMASLRDRLAMLETEQQADEGFGTFLAKNANKFAKGVKAGYNTGALRGAAATRAGMLSKTGNAIGRTGKAIASNPVKAGAGLAALGAGAAYAATPTPTGSTGGGGGGGGHGGGQGGKTTPTAPTTTPADPELIKQIQATMGELADIETPEVMAELDRARAALTTAGVAE